MLRAQRGKSFLIVLVLGFALGACSYRHEKGTPTADAGIADPKARAAAGTSGTSEIGQYSFGDVKTQVLHDRCVKCHKGYDDYQKVYAARDAIYRAVFVERRMPKNNPPLGREEAAILKSWLASGAPEELPFVQPPVPTPAPALFTPTWTNVQSAFFDRHCTECHNSGYAEKDLDLTNFKMTRANASLIFTRVVVEGTMPPSEEAAGKITAEEKTLLMNWIASRMPGPEATQR
jgi:uncharacterized membrane protein